jgi:hypothetical protein
VTDPPEAFLIRRDVPDRPRVADRCYEHVLGSGEKRLEVRFGGCWIVVEGLQEANRFYADSPGPDAVARGQQACRQ